jgi:hypothetical protein
MSTSDTCVTISPYFVIKDGQIDKARQFMTALVEKTKSEEACLYYGFTIHGNRLHCREGYRDGAGALAHLDNVGALLGEWLESGSVELTELQIHGAEAELAKLREPLAGMNPDYWVLEQGFRNP